MKKKIYVVKIGRETGIYDEYKKCEAQVKGFSGAKFRGFDYRTEFEKDDEDKEGSLRHAFMRAEEFMSDVRIGGLKLVYQGENQDYTEEESWKKEGFLPFGEEIPDDAGTLQGEGENDDIDETVDGFVFIEDDSELPFAIEVPSGHGEPESREGQEAFPEESAVRDYDHTKEEEIFSELQIPERPNQNKPWVEMLLYIAGYRQPKETYVGRYHVPTLYVTLLKFVFRPKSILCEFVNVYKCHIYPEIRDEVSLECSPEDWIDDACEAWEDSDEYRVLKQRFEKNGMEYLDFDEIFYRYDAFVEDNAKSSLRTNSKTYKAMKKYIRQGGHSLSGLYRELTENEVYREELMKVSGPYDNPDFDQKIYGKETEASFKQQSKQQFKQQIMYTESIGMKLKEKVIGQDDAIDKLEFSFFHAEKSARQKNKRKGPRGVFLFAGPSGVGKTFTAQLFADELGLPFRRFDMSGYANRWASEELAGSSTIYKDSKPGVLTEYVNANPHSVLLFDEIEKAHIRVIQLFLQVLDDGICFDRFYDTNISFEDTIIIFTTNAGKQRYSDGKDENLTVLPDKVVIDALAKDINPETRAPFFPPEILSRMSSHTVIMFNHLKADALRRVVERDVENQLGQSEQETGYNLRVGKSKLAKTVLYSMGGSADARNASVLAGKLIDQQLYEFTNSMMQKTLWDNTENLRQIEWDCDFTEATDEVREIYSGEKNRVVPVLGTMQYEPFGSLKENDIIVKNTTDPDGFMKMLHEERVLFAVIDYTLGSESAESSLNIADARTAGGVVFRKTAEEFDDIPIYILYGGESGYQYTDREKNDLVKRGASGFVDREFYENELEMAYWDVCCRKVMNTLARKHQLLTYKTRKIFDDRHPEAGKIEFYDLKLETAVESEDMSSLLSDAERPNTKFNDVIGAEDAKDELRYYVNYLKKPKDFLKRGVMPPKGILLYGPPGTGKTMLARAMAGESDVAFFQTSAAEFKSPHTGESEANIRRIFERARKYAPAILFIDEIDVIGRKRTGSDSGTESMLTVLFTQMDGFLGADSNRPVFVLAATNYGATAEDDGIGSLDDALLRRFDNQIYVDLPNESEREQYILKMLADRNITTVSEDAVRDIAEKTEGQSLSNIQNVFGRALRTAIKQSRDITDDDLLSTLKKFNSLPSDAERPNTRFDDVIGAEDAKDELRYFIKYLKEPKEFLKKGARPPKGILLYGDPGTGKTMLARAMAGESGVTFLQTSATEFMDSHVGGSEANIRRLFAKARKYAPAILFIDEIDAIGKKRTGSETTHHTEGMLNALLTEMDGFRGADSNRPVFVLAATNSKARGESGGIGSLDDALLRRFDNQIYVDLPKESEREQYILKMLADRNVTTASREAARSIAERTTGKSLADLQNVFELAFRNAVRQSRNMTEDDLLTALEQYNHGERKEHTPEYYKSVAIHETGHAYVSYISGDKPSYITIESRGNFGGYMQHANQEDATEYTRDELLAWIRTSLAGRAAEQVFYGKEKSLNTGAYGDLQHATDVAFQIVCTYGMEEDQLIALSKDEILQSELAGEYTAKVNEILKTEMKNAIEIIENAKDKIRRIADVLVKENRLTGKQFEELMEAEK